MRSGDHGTMVMAAAATGWPLVSVMPPMGALVTAPAAARAYVRAALAAWSMDGLADIAELVASELVSNAVSASTGHAGAPLYAGGRLLVVQVRLLSDWSRLLVQVWDQAPGIPERRQASLEDESGRGLLLVDQLTGSRWGWHPAKGRPGKCVWAELSGDTA